MLLLKLETQKYFTQYRNSTASFEFQTQISVHPIGNFTASMEFETQTTSKFGNSIASLQSDTNHFSPNSSTTHPRACFTTTLRSTTNTPLLATTRCSLRHPTTTNARLQTAKTMCGHWSGRGGREVWRVAGN